MERILVLYVGITGYNDIGKIISMTIKFFNNTILFLTLKNKK